jgi:hypothetical protein
MMEGERIAVTSPPGWHITDYGGVNSAKWVFAHYMRNGNANMPGNTESRMRKSCSC